MKTETGPIRRSDALDLLAEASGILASSFDLASTLPLVADLCVRQMADYCAIVAHHGEGGVSLVEASRRTGVHADTSDPELLAQHLQEHGFETVVTAPLLARKERIGTFVVASYGRGAFNGRTQKLAAVLALQLANALDQAILFQRTHRVADRLQRALLPDTLPRVPGAEFHWAYRPASDEAEIGGDWYDAFSLPNGQFGISVGDVAGHGLEAATIMGELRQALRTISVAETSPAAVLQHANEVLSLRKGIGMVTAIFAFYRPDLRELTYAVAGHPPPVLAIHGGFSGFLPGGGMPLGVDRHVNAIDWTVTLPSRSGVVFYTDGMTEYSRDVLQGEEKLLDASVRAFESDPENPAIALQERVFDAGSNRDDAATLTITCEPGPTASSMRFSAIPLAAPVTRAHLHRFCDEQGLDDTRRFALITAVGEAVANAIEHAYNGAQPGYFFLRTAADADTVTVEVEDQGRWRPFQRRDERGRGIVLMHELMDRVRITTAQNRTVISLLLNRADDVIS